MHESLIGQQTPIHVTKFDGSYHRRWPARFVLKRASLYLLSEIVGGVVTRTPAPHDDPNPMPIRWPGEIYLFDDRWYNVSRVQRAGRCWYYVNVATPAEFDGEQFHCVDLDLDVSWYTDEAPRVLDEDEFVAHSKSMRYPAEVVERARAAVDDVLGLIGERAFPFDRG